MGLGCRSAFLKGKRKKKRRRRRKKTIFILILLLNCYLLFASVAMLISHLKWLFLFPVSRARSCRDVKGKRKILLEKYQNNNNSICLRICHETQHSALASIAVCRSVGSLHFTSRFSYFIAAQRKILRLGKFATFRRS